jgi:hypothetical protein
MGIFKFIGLGVGFIGYHISSNDVHGLGTVFVGLPLMLTGSILFGSGLYKDIKEKNKEKNKEKEENEELHRKINELININTEMKKNISDMQDKHNSYTYKRDLLLPDLSKQDFLKEDLSKE